MNRLLQTAVALDYDAMKRWVIEELVIENWVKEIEEEPCSEYTKALERVAEKNGVRVMDLRREVMR